MLMMKQFQDIGKELKFHKLFPVGSTACIPKSNMKRTHTEGGQRKDVSAGCEQHLVARVLCSTASGRGE